MAGRGQAAARYCCSLTRRMSFSRLTWTRTSANPRMLKGLMDATKRRFKVVFCGLHNVLRNTERANHPLAHFGEPICVGPLLGDGDQKQARALITGPLAAAGYTFEKDTLATHILVWTNYYPSFIQLYGDVTVEAFA